MIEKTNRKDKCEQSEKVLAMYHAVWKLLAGGRDPEKMKVADITECAGIGKGTAYEYFRSKEEIVSKAVQYNCLMQFELLEKRAGQEKSYRKALEACFEWISENHDRFQIVLQLIRKSGCLCEKEESNSVQKALQGFISYIVQLGRKEMLIRENVSDHLAAVQILSQLLGFFACQELTGCTAKEAELEMTKDFLCDNIIKSLS